MNETLLTKPKRKTTAEYESLADQLLTDMRRLDEVMQKDRAEIDRLKAETLLLREEAAHLETENLITLSRLKAIFA